LRKVPLLLRRDRTSKTHVNVEDNFDANLAVDRNRNEQRKRHNKRGAKANKARAP
jgi:hypothetical protein